MIQICWKLQALCIRDVTRFYGDSSPYENEMDEENKSENSTKKRTYGLDEVSAFVSVDISHNIQQALTLRFCIHWPGEGESTF